MGTEKTMLSRPHFGLHFSVKRQTKFSSIKKLKVHPPAAASSFFLRPLVLFSTSVLAIIT